MNPFYFGSSQRPLFGIYHPPKGTARNLGIVICPPMGQEYMRTHRALRQLALQLTRVGFHALRFDYSGTGDSAGENADASLVGWLDDVATATEELKDTAGVRAVSLAGIRLGATLGFLVGGVRSDVESVVLWDPVVRGAAYVNEILDLEAGHAPGHGSNERGGAIGVGGFALTPEFRAELDTIDLTKVPRPGAKRLELVVSEERPEYHLLREHLKSLPGSTTYRHIPSGGDWADAERLGAALLPQAIIQEIVSSYS